MACEEFENRISEYLENQLPPADRAPVAAHLAGCADCRAFAQQLDQLDRELLRTVTAPALSANFKTNLQQRIRTQPVMLSEAQRAERKRQLQAEYDAGMARLNPFALAPRKSLKGLNHAGLIALGGWLAWLLLPQLGYLLAVPALNGINQSLVLSSLVGALFVAMGLAAAFPRQVKRLWSAV